MRIRLAEAGELGRIAALKQQIHTLHVQGRPDLFAPLDDWESFMARTLENDAQLWLAEEGENVLGYAISRPVVRPANPCMKERRYLHVEEICVDAHSRRMGVGRALIEAMKEEARSLECPAWSWTCGASTRGQGSFTRKSASGPCARSWIWRSCDAAME